MDINRIYSELDSLEYTKIEDYLADRISEATEKSLFEIQVPLLNEMIGFLRDTTQFDKGNKYKKVLLELLESCNQQGTMNYATSLLNIANFDRAAGAFSNSLEEYKKCEEIYGAILPAGDYLWAGLYNNESLLYQMMGDNLAAIGALGQALRIVEAIPERRIEVATTYTNIAQSLAALGQMDEAEENVKAALDIFAETDYQDYHYSAAAAVMGIIAYNRGDFVQAADYYDKASEVVKRIMGENDNYRLLISNRDAILAMLPTVQKTETDTLVEVENGDDADSGLLERDSDSISGLELCKAFYLEYGKSAIKERFPQYIDKIAIGLFGEGSECLGCDDKVSRDHDWGPGFMLLVSRQTYGEIGRQLEQLYDSLTDTYMGYKRNQTKEAFGRVGVVIIEDYFSRWLGRAFLTTNGRLEVDRMELGNIPEFVLCNLTNGMVWLDGEKTVTGLRDSIGLYYDDMTWKKKLGTWLVRMGQTGQYNIKRCLDRGDKVTANIYLGEYIKSTLQVLFLLNREYAPYEKWMLKKASGLELHPEITDCLKAISDMKLEDDNLLMTIEIIAQIVLAALIELGIVNDDEDNWYLEKLGRKMIEDI